MEWRFIDTGVNDGYMNMALDEAILEAHLQGACPPTLRVYRWHPATLSVGYFQDLETDVDTKRCAALGIDIVRRPTGGRSVFHDDELTYSVIASERYGLPRTLGGCYKLLNEGLIAAYRRLGVGVCVKAQEQRPSPTRSLSSACFSTAGLADLTCQGRKLCGSAQFRRDGALLQHGSLPIRLDTQTFFSLLKFPTDTARAEAEFAFRRKAASLSEISGNRIGWEELKEALLQGFQDALGIMLCKEPLTSEELDLAQKLATEKYRSFGWSYDGRYEA